MDWVLDSRLDAQSTGVRAVLFGEQVRQVCSQVILAGDTGWAGWSRVLVCLIPHCPGVNP